MSDYVPLPVARLVELQREIAQINRTTRLEGVGSDHVQISEMALAEVAPLSEWSLNEPFPGKDFHFQHSITVDGVKFVAISAGPIFQREVQDAR